ncbi:cation-translocating P-type ATPase [Candidatus Roizmanbacteria bacterium]|nr:cation-translocating P-type ATPase [Candidatus Roizmanbacteria bacterium]
MKGLTSDQAISLLKQYGPNTLEVKKKKNIFLTFFGQFNNFLTILLIVAAFASFFIGEAIDGSLILAIVVLNACFGIYQEAKAEGAIAALKKITVSKVRVIRDGIQIEIQSQDLVPGDICFIEEGVKIPADGIIVESMNLEVNESVLTGESMPVPKMLQDEIFSGTIAAKGRGLLQVKQTGMQTKFGKIAQNLSVIDDTQTPLQKKLEDLTRLIGIIGIGAAIIVFIISYLQGSGYFPAFLLAISLAVAVVPEGLPAVMTITLSMGVKEMSNRRSIIRKLSAIEALGSVTLIATDKTGTLTTNKMKVKEVYVNGQITNIQNPITKQIPITNNQLPIIKTDAYSLLILNGILCSTASLVYVHDHGSYDVLGDPTEGALLYLAHEIGLKPDEVRKEWKIIEEMPFDSVTKRMSVVVNNVGAGLSPPVQKYIFSKGAPESILEISKVTQEERSKIEIQMEVWARKGLRVLAFAYSNSIDSVSNSLTREPVNPLIFLGMVAIHDAPRPEVREAVERAKKAGIRVIMITGDNEKTAEAIGMVAGIVEEGSEILTGAQVEAYSDAELLQILPRVRIFARTSPFHKHRIVSLYQKLGEIVAVTGDGVNDAIALKQADVGVAMGLVGTDVARETADMVITDDNFASIVNAIEEGRNIIKNLKNAIIYLLACNITEAFALIGGLVLGFHDIFFPIQLLYINLVTDGIPALSLAFSPRDPHLMAQKPDRDMVLLKSHERSYIFYLGVIGTVLILGSFGIFMKYFGAGMAGTAAFTILTLIQSFILIDQWLSHRSLHKHLPHLLSPVFFFAFLFPFFTQFAIVTHPTLAAWFKIAPVSPLMYGVLILISALSFVGIKGVKMVLKQ